MPRLLVHVEGQTEETFVKEVLRPHLVAHRSHSITVDARLIGNARRREQRGGIIPWTMARRDIVRHLKEDKGVVVSTMVDYYRLPQDWTKQRPANQRPSSRMAKIVEDQMSADVLREMGDGFNPDRFIPYVMMHEFEAMLFSDCEGFGQGIGRSDLIPEFKNIRDSFDSPEEIDDLPGRAPSKRIKTLIHGYEKPLMGNLAALAIGLDTIREACPHFQEWLTRLERLSQ